MNKRPDLRVLAAVFVHQALIALGELPNPATNTTEPDLEQAHFAIDLLEVLEERTRAARSQEEEQYLLDTLVQLRLAYVRAYQERTATAPSPPPQENQA